MRNYESINNNGLFYIPCPLNRLLLASPTNRAIFTSSALCASFSVQPSPPSPLSSCVISKRWFVRLRDAAHKICSTSTVKRSEFFVEVVERFDRRGGSGVCSDDDDDEEEEEEEDEGWNRCARNSSRPFNRRDT